MNQSDIPTLRDRLTELAEALGSKAPGEGGVKAWLLALRDFPMPDVTDALDQWLRTKTKMPAPADIRSILASRLSDRVEQKAIAEAAEFVIGGKRIISESQRRFARRQLDHIASILHAIRHAEEDPWWHALVVRWRKGEDLEWIQLVNTKLAWERSRRPAEWAPPGFDPEAEAERAAIQAEGA